MDGDRCRPAIDLHAVDAGRSYTRAISHPSGQFSMHCLANSFNPPFNPTPSIGMGNNFIVRKRKRKNPKNNAAAAANGARCCAHTQCPANPSVRSSGQREKNKNNDCTSIIIIIIKKKREKEWKKKWMAPFYFDVDRRWCNKWTSHNSRLWNRPPYSINARKMGQSSSKSIKITRIKKNICVEEKKDFIID